MCGIFGCFDSDKAAEMTAVGLHIIQHRANDFAGMVTSDGTNAYAHTGEGSARDVFVLARPDKVLNKLHGRHSIGHIRYSTAKRKKDDQYRRNIQPLVGTYGKSWFALAHNGNLPDTERLSALVGGRRMATNMDTEYIVRLIEEGQTGDIVEDLKRVLPLLRGSYALVLLLPNMLIGVQGPNQNRPLCLGKRNGSHFLSSESCGFDGIEAQFLRELTPGEILCISHEGLASTYLPEVPLRRCFFELNYFSHPTSIVFGRSVRAYQHALGARLEEVCPAHGADIVTSVPDSSNAIADGYARSGRSGRRDQVIYRNHYVGRSFIQESQAKRDVAVANKFTFEPHGIRGKKIVVVDDSLVRSTTLRRIVKKLRQYDAAEVHLRIATPPIMHPCRYGIDISSYEELAAARTTPEELSRELGADSLRYFPLSEQWRILGDQQNFCFSCITGEYWDQPAV